MSITSESDEIADRWAAIEIRLVEAEQRLNATIAAGQQNEKAASSSITADAGEGLQTSDRWTAIERRLQMIERTLSLPTNASLSTSIPAHRAVSQASPEDSLQRVMFGVHAMWHLMLGVQIALLHRAISLTDFNKASAGSDSMSIREGGCGVKSEGPGVWASF